MILNLLPDDRDDDHVLALFRQDKHWGALAKSNFTGLRFREPVYRDLRELIMTYFEHYYNVHGEKTLRGYNRPLDASRYIHLNWAWDEAGENRLYYDYFYRRKAIPLVSPCMAKRLSRVTDRVYAAETLYTNLKQSFGNRKP